MQQVLSYILFVFNKIVDLLSVKPFPDMPITIFQFMATILVLKYLFRFIFGGTREIELFANTSIRDYSRKMNSANRKQQLIEIDSSNDKKKKMSAFKEPNMRKATAKEIAEMEELLAEYR